jgi:homoserine kinase
MHGEQLASGGFHADNVAPSLLGGIILICSNQNLDVHSLPVPDELHAAVVYPEVEVLTKTARSILKADISLRQHIEQSGNLGGFVTGFIPKRLRSDGRTLQDVVIEPQRAQLIPNFHQVQEAAFAAGALGCSISGAGPSMIALCRGEAVAKWWGHAMQQVFPNAGIHNELFISAVNPHGAIEL